MESKNIDLKEIKRKMFTKLKGTGWDVILKNFILSSDMDEILNKLEEGVRIYNRRFVPGLKEVFTAFELCHLDNLKVVVVSNEPYSNVEIANGIAFCCKKTNKPEKALKYIHEEIMKDVYNNSPKITLPNDLTSWCKQGILLLNSSLTIEVCKSQSHHEIWNPFMFYLFDVLPSKKKNILYVFMGEKAKELSDIIPDSEQKIFVSHPISSTYKKDYKWDSKELFLKINEFTTMNYNTKIKFHGK